MNTLGDVKRVDGATDEAEPPALVGQLPARIRGDALRRGLKYTLLAWIPGAFWQGATGATALTPLAKYVGANDQILAVMIAAAPALSSLLQIPGALVVQKLGRRKTFFLWTVTPHRTLYVLIGLIPWILPAGTISTALVMAGLIFLSMGLNSFGGQAWVGWMADMVPTRIRGRYFSRRTRVGVGVLALTTVLVALILDEAEEAWVGRLLAPVVAWSGMPPLIVLLSVVFMVAGTVGMLDILAFTKVDEPAMKRVPAEPLWEKLTRPLRDKPFRRFVTYWTVWTCANFWCAWLWMKYFLDFLEGERTRAAAAGTPVWWHEHLFLVAAVTQPVAFMVGQFIGYPMWGRAVDRFGRKPVFLVSSALHTVSWFAWVCLSPTILPWMVLIQVAGGIVGGGMDIAAFNTMLQFNRKGGAGYQAVGSVVFSCAGAVAAFVAGSLSVMLRDFQVEIGGHVFGRYALLIGIGMVMKYVGDFVFLPRMMDGDAKPAGHALRFMFEDMYGLANTLLFEPLRSGVKTGGRLVRWK